MKIYNSLTKRKEDFVPLDGNNVKMYACGITVSGEAHIGHGYQALIYDIMRKYLKKSGYQVTYARNYTDVDDKIIARSHETGIPADEYAAQMIENINKVMSGFCVDDPDVWLKATENIENIIEFVSTLIKKGHAYPTAKGDVYFDVASFPGYGKLSNRNVDDALDGVRVEAGEELSFNAVVGRRAAEAGYVQAMEPAYGADVSGTGGGVCQVSTALYRSALQAGLTVLQRNAAVRPVPYCPMGQEAAVSDQGLDLVIENNTPSALFIAARAYRSGDAAYAQIDWIGAPLHTKYVLESQTESLGMIEEPVYVRDSEGEYAQYTDERIEAGKAQEGFRVRVERVAPGADGEEPAREVIGEYTYEPVPPTVYVGIQEREN